jgi:hypothetical protein
VADFNGDGKPDLAVSDGSGVWIMLGNGDATFQPPVNYPIPNGAASLAVGDFNSDGKQDLVAGNDGNLAILLNNGDGTFQPAILYPVGFEVSNLAVGDFNRDGRLDVAATSFFLGTVNIYLGNGAGNLTAGAAYHTLGPAGGLCVAVADFNGDGNPDLAVTTTGAIQILLGKGDGSFQRNSFFAVGEGPVYAAVGDFNRDGKPDLAVANNSSGNASVLTNTTP